MAGKKRNIFLHEVNRMSYSSEGAHNTDSFPVRLNPRQHAEHIESLLKQCLEEIPTQSKGEVLRAKEGLYLEFSGETNKELNTKSLENIRKGIRLLNIQEENDTTKATVYVPLEKTEYYLQKVEEYKKSLGGKGNPKNNDLIRSIENVRRAKIESFWIGKKEFMPVQEAVWCEVWLRYKQDKDVVEANFKNCCKELNIACKSQKISFPERMVCLIKANKDNLIDLLRTCDDITEFRRAPESTSFFDGLSRGEQKDWEDDLLERLRIGDSKTTVCLLDTGISAEHPLIKPHIVRGGIQSVDTAWFSSDHDGHGTEMAGLLLYYDLKEKLISTEEVFVSHKLESVKILPPRGENDPELYGAVTEQAVALAEIQNPKVNRSICMAVSAPEYTEGNGRPSSWSGTLDSLAAGVDSEDRDKRLILVSAGNVLPNELAKGGYPEANKLHSVENPGQSWNALTIGAYNQDVDIQHEDFSGFAPLADVGELSPYSATSVIWDKKWPIKPEILLNGSNVATNGTDYSECPDFSLLTTGKDYSKHHFSTIWATSSATAQAAWMASQIYVEYPDIWPETVRGLMVHSARWTEKMRRQFCNGDKKRSGRRNLVRSCGYGIPNLNRAIQCMNNSVNIISEEILQPYKKKESGSYAMNEMHLYTLPWPKEVLRDLGEADAELRVTLSYFIEPSPEAVGWKDKYRYASSGLRFDVINNNETLEDFKKRINVEARGEDKKDKGDGTSGSDRWFLGKKVRDVGSLHSDFMKLTGVELSEINQIAVYPVSGWWKERGYLNRFNDKIRYSLIITISTPNQDVDLYTPIINQIATPVEVNI
mgnify:FL=1